MDIHKFFAPPGDHAGLDVVVWPMLEDQISLIELRVQQTARVLAYYTGKERDYQSISREHVLLTATLHTLRCVELLTRTAT